MGFQERLSLLLEGRKKYPWGEQIGLNRGVVSGMFDKGAVPKWEALNAIRRYENCSPTWLTEGEGEPFVVTRRQRDDECAEAVAARLDDEPWHVVIVTDNAAVMFVLWLPCSYTMTPKEGAAVEVAYRAIEVITGGGRKSLRVVRDRARAGIALEAMSSARTHQIARGEVGTWRLFLAPDAWLRNAPLISLDHSIFDWPDETIVLSPDERAVIDVYRTMCDDQRSHFKAVGTALAQSKPDYKPGN